MSIMKCNDYYIYRVQYYRKHWKLHKHSKEMHDAAERFTKFKIHLLEHFLGTTFSDLVAEYGLGAMPCGIVLMERLTGIIFDDGQRSCTLLIPITNREAIGWAKANAAEFQTKQMKLVRTEWRTRIGDKLWLLDHYRNKKI